GKAFHKCRTRPCDTAALVGGISSRTGVPIRDDSERPRPCRYVTGQTRRSPRQLRTPSTAIRIAHLPGGCYRTDLYGSVAGASGGDVDLAVRVLGDREPGGEGPAFG